MRKSNDTLTDFFIRNQLFFLEQDMSKVGTTKQLTIEEKNKDVSHKHRKKYFGSAEHKR